MIDAWNIASLTDRGLDTLKLRTHGILPMLHHRFIITAQHQKRGVVLPDAVDVHTCLPLQGQHTLDPRFHKPWDQWLHGTVGIDKDLCSVRLNDRDQLQIKRMHEFFVQLVRDHRSVIIRHILGKGHKLRLYFSVNQINDLFVKIAKLPIDPQHPLLLVIKGIKMLFDPKQRARKPEKALEREPRYVFFARIVLKILLQLCLQAF